jgi:hypothetical protein
VPVQVGDREFFIDLLFYHYTLHRFVVLELKLGRFEPEHIGRLNFYLVTSPTAQSPKPDLRHGRSGFALNCRS